MSDETALLRAIAAHPDEDTPRLALADYHDEHGNHPRAAFIRGQVELARLTDDSPHRREVAFRCRQLLDAHEAEWLVPRGAFAFDWAWSRGFVETSTTTPSHHDMDEVLFAMHPFRRLWMWRLEGNADGLWSLPDNKLTALDLTGNQLDGRQLRKLAKMPHFPYVRELGLMFNALRDTAVKVLCGEDFFQRLDLLRLGANPFTDYGRDQLRAHFGARVTFAHDREPERLYTIQNDYLHAGWGKDFTQLLVNGTQTGPRIAFFDHAGNLLRVEERLVEQSRPGDFPARLRVRAAARDKWLEELGYEPATIKVKRFQFAEEVSLRPFNMWADAFDSPLGGQQFGMADGVEKWLEEGQFRFTSFGTDAWFDRTGAVTDT